jgi:DNA anti-recombination protein RmuC
MSAAIFRLRIAIVGPKDFHGEQCFKMAEATEAARATLAQLNEKLAEFDRRAIELENEATGISLAAMTGDAASRKRLDALNRERSAHELESRNIKSAIRAQEALVAAAEREEAMAAARQNAARAAEVADRIAARGKRIDEAFEAARAELEGLKSDVDELHKLGVTHPRGEQLKVFGGLALASALMGLPIKAERDHLAPRERHSFSELCTGWARGVTNWAAPFLDREAA